MLSELAIKNFAIIDDVRISFGNGFSVLTGETGAGKSIIIQAVNLLLGSRASGDLVRAGCDAAELEAFFEISEASDAAEILSAQGMDSSEGLMIRRVVSSAGKSRVFINSRQATLDLLKQVTKNLAGVSSQHAHQGLLKEENHLDILDAFAGTQGLRKEVQALYQTILPLNANINAHKEELARHRKEQELLAFQIEEIEAAAILPNEDEDLEKKRLVLLNANKIFEAVNRAVHEIHDSDGSVLEKLSVLKNDMERSGEGDDTLETISAKISSAIFDLQDIAGELRDYSSGIDLDPASLEMTDQRLDLIARLKRKYGGSLDALFREYEALQGQVSRTRELEAEIEALSTRVAVHVKAIKEKAADLSGKRKKAAETLSRLAGKELSALEMKQAEFAVSFDTRPAGGQGDIVTDRFEKIGPDGMDRVGFLLSPNPGEGLKPLARIASGGELSRIVLALKAVLSKTQSLETLIFDEVDAGIGGATSEKVGIKLKQLSDSHQVICITHLAQIAKYATNQYRISKSVVNGRTATTIVPLETEDERVEEIARMMGGKIITDATRIHAKELLAQAAHG